MSCPAFFLRLTSPGLCESKSTVLKLSGEVGHDNRRSVFWIVQLLKGALCAKGDETGGLRWKFADKLNDRRLIFNEVVQTSLEHPAAAHKLFCIAAMVKANVGGRW